MMTVALLTFVGFSAFFVGLQLDAGRMSPRVRLALYVVALLAFVTVAMTGCDDTYQGAETTRFDHSNAWDEDGWTFATVTDTETGVVYLIFRDCEAQWAVGGITPLLRRDGSVTIDDSMGVDRD